MRGGRKYLGQLEGLVRQCSTPPTSLLWEPWPAPSDHPQPRLCSCISKNPFPDKQSPQPRLPPNRHLRPPGLGIKACFAKEALCLEKHPSPAAHSFKEPALFCVQKAPPDLRAGSGLTWADVGGLLISGQALTPLGGREGCLGQARRGLPSRHGAPFPPSAHLSPHPLCPG